MKFGWINFWYLFCSKASSRALISFPYAFLFQEILSFASIGLPRFRRVLDSFAVILIDCHTGISIFTGVLTTGM
jgi:hypothetical protein